MLRLPLVVVSLACVSLPPLTLTIESFPSSDHGINFVAFPFFFLSQDLGLNFVSQGFSGYHSLKIVMMNWVSFFLPIE